MEQMPIARSCGPCRGCCKPFRVPAVDKDDINWCQHSTPCKGCGIYTIRPPACREYTCIWLDGLGKEEDRPDRLGVVLNLRDFVLAAREITVLHLWEIEVDALKKARIEVIADNALQMGLVVKYHRLAGDRYMNRIVAAPQHFSSDEVELFNRVYRD